eukprot:TRINITY_DN1442_c0_g1_i11.p1 TRINITY_DN1442_c0_g1~~TRINITY_DN1442_c0_g1_i11.p1  ORF type:complete len:313 (+),score=38.41 TRINITY_DN1442_c0_g1_i11:576-1514(+)
MPHLKNLCINIHFLEDVDFLEALGFCSAKLRRLTLGSMRWDITTQSERSPLQGISPFLLTHIAEKFGTDLLELNIDFSKNLNSCDRYLSTLSLCENLEILRLEGIDWENSVTLENLIMSLNKLKTLQLINNEGASEILIPEHRALQELVLESMYICTKVEVKAPNIKRLTLENFEICDEVIIDCKNISYLSITEVHGSFVFHSRNNFGSVKFPLSELIFGNVQMSVQEFDSLLRNSSSTLKTLDVAGDLPNIVNLHLNLPLLENIDFTQWTAPRKCVFDCPNLKTVCLCDTNIDDVTINADALQKYCKKNRV